MWNQRGSQGEFHPPRRRKKSTGFVFDGKKFFYCVLGPVLIVFEDGKRLIPESPVHLSVFGVIIIT
jgi:hypothetical protein